MPTFRVTVLRTERIEFTVDADDRDDAEARYLGEGDETGSETVSTEIESVTEDQKA